jgi:hypothetical protein
VLIRPRTFTRIVSASTPSAIAGAQAAIAESGRRRLDGVSRKISGQVLGRNVERVIVLFD